MRDSAPDGTGRVRHGVAAAAGRSVRGWPVPEDTTPYPWCGYTSDPWWDEGEKQWYTCVLTEGHPGKHRLCVATEG